MSLVPDTKKSAQKENQFFVVLVLSQPPAPWKVKDWYWTPIAGVPFLLRNILSIQQAGAKHLILFMDKSIAGIDELCRRAENDPRVRLKLECHLEPEKWVSSLQENSTILFLDGSTLQKKPPIEKTLSLTRKEQNPKTDRSIHLSPNDLKTLMQGIDDRGFLPWRDNAPLQAASVPVETEEHPIFHIIYLANADDVRIARPEDFHSAGNRLIQSCGLSNDSFMDQRLTRFISRQLTCQIIKTPLTPNQITLISFGVGLGSAACFLFGNYGMGVAGAGLLLLSTWMDCADGEVARLKFQESPLGKQMDIICDNLVHIAVFFSLGLGLSAATGNDLFIFFGGLAALGCLVSFVLLSQEIVKSKMSSDEGLPRGDQKNSITDKLANRDFTYFLFFMALIARLDIFLALAAAGSNIFAVFLIYKKFRTGSIR